MQQKAFTLHNRGMNRDLSVSKADESSAYENHNIRITATDHDTLLSVTNERGNKEIDLGEFGIVGDLVGWNVLNNHIILFTHEEQDSSDDGQDSSNDIFVLFSKAINPDEEGIAGGGGNIHDFDFDDDDQDEDEPYTGGGGDSGGSLPDAPPEVIDPGNPYDVDPDESIDVLPDDAYDDSDTPEPPEPYDPEPEPEEPLPDVDHIYRIDYENGEFIPHEIFNGNLGFDVKHPIESVVYFETENIQKIYWVDGEHVLRFMNFMADADEQAKWDNTYFDSNRIVEYGVSAEISKDNSGNTRANGVIQYLLSYFNKHGQETGYAWISDLVYLSPSGRGGAGDETNNNKVYISLSGLDTRFTNFRIYSVFRSSVNGDATAYIVGEGKTEGGTATVIDDGAHLSVDDVTRLIYLGSKDVHAGTLEHKDQTLFLGDLQSVGKRGYDTLKDAIKNNMFSYEPEDLVDGEPWKSSCIEFMYSSDTHESGLIKDIPYPDRKTTYQYDSQLEFTSSNITMFKGGEKYRFALVFRDKNGVSTDAFWIGDAVNRLYPVIDITKHRIRRPVVKCTLPEAVVSAIRNPELGLATVQLMIAEASYADRSVKAQGIVNPTMFNTWERYSDRLYSMPSWISRPRWSNFAWRHFEPVHNANGSDGEIQCNQWSDEVTPYPYYRLKDFESPNSTIYEKLNTVSKANYIMLLYRVRKEKAKDMFTNDYAVDACVISATLNESITSQTAFAALDAFVFANNNEFDRLDKKGDSVTYADPNGNFELVIQFTGRIWGSGSKGETRAKSALTSTNDRLVNEFGVDSRLIVSTNVFMSNWYGYVSGSSGRLNKNYYWNVVFSASSDVQTGDYHEAFNYNTASSTSRWLPVSPAGSGTAENSASYYRKHFMFVDENVVTLNSPEIDYNAVSLDNVSNHKFRIVGVAKVSSYMSDYTVDASHGYLSGENLVNESFSPDGDGLLSWPLWMEKGLTPNGDVSHPASTYDYTSDDYIWGGSIVRYWLYMWNHAGIISGYTGEKEDEGEYSRLHSKVFANLRFCPSTIYNNYRTYENIYNLTEPGSIRIFNYPASQYIGINVGDETKYYDGWINTSLSLPASFRYSLYYSSSVSPSSKVTKADSSFLNTNEPVPITFASNAHAVISMPSWIDTENNKYMQEILPYAFESEVFETPGRDTENDVSDAIVPWVHGLTCVAHGGQVSEFKIIANGDYSEEFGNISIYRTIVGSVLGLPYVRGWVKGIDHYGSSERVYDLIPVEDGYTYLVDVSNVHISDDTHTVSLVGADVIARAETGVSGTTVTVHYGNIVGTTMATTNDAYSLSVIDVGTGQVIQTIASTPFIEYGVHQEAIRFQTRNNADRLEEGDKYLLIGEVYYDFDADEHDTRYGGITEAAIESNRFIPAGPQFAISKLRTRSNIATIYGNQGDTYFQRWDCLKTKPLSGGAANGVIDVTSVMIETHINIDGRYDNLRGTSKLASINPENFGQLNPVYSQVDNFIATRDLDDDFDQDAYRSYVTWTLDKADSADIDEWTHVTLANVLKLDGDKGVCTAIRRFQNTLIAFQDRAISEILFNSRTQLTTTDGVPVEIANSGKVDGKRYITNKYGCTNKWSIVEGKSALYFVDNINKAFCAFNGNIENLSIKFGFGSWFRRFNTIESWTPDTFKNVVSFYDRINSDVYLVGEDMYDERSTLVYNETIGAFTSFYDYDAVPMMANVEDRFISYRNNKLWLQNEGFYGLFFGQKRDYWVQYRVTPDPFGDKIWTNIDYRADFYRVLDEVDGEPVTLYRESEIIAGDLFDDNTGVYQEDTTFDNLRMWDEYQQTEIDFGKDFYSANPGRKKFRIWRLTVPRAKKSDSNKYGLDRMRNPWISLKFTKKLTEDDDDQKKDLMQLHDITVRYFE